MLVFILSNYILFCYFRSLLFPTERQKGGGYGKERRWEVVGEIKGGETAIRIYYVTKESIFNERKPNVPRNACGI